MGLGVPDGDKRAIAALDAEVRAMAEALGTGLAPRLAELAPSLTRDGENQAPAAELLRLALDREPEPDPATLAACIAAHRAYVTRRGRPDGLSLGGLALARLLVWAARAALLGPAPRMIWLGPAARRPTPSPGQHVIAATARARVGRGTREAVAEALVAA